MSAVSTDSKAGGPRAQRLIAWGIAEGLPGITALILRIYIGYWVFFRSGLTKIQSWDSTLMLFEYEYAVPVLSPKLAAYAGTAAELVLPVLLILGLGGRCAAFALFVFNIVAVLSYPALAGKIGELWHVAWGAGLAILVMYGPGVASVDHFIVRWLNNNKAW
ncbi:MAG: DoxX family membrane protein [Gammaproteobacteria bacterium]|nr:DoxX family membrane protein [Gammaproteobacteria bacterium]